LGAALLKRKRRRHEGYKSFEEAKTKPSKDRLWTMKLFEVEE